ncbi:MULTISPECIES: Na+/H+ antiporter subunit E [Chitinophagaceae]|uniref:Na+/H+ antiporter subunit E n=1 Tax=Chitinophagaceae TaxID=563835 RepID=UPI001957209D|nr:MULTISPECIES: Na+/H+ antiporter subunit E [Chitinophagaceae]
MMQKRFLLNVMLTLVWIAITGTFTYLNFLLGFAISYFILWIISRNSDDKRYFTIAFKVLGFFFFFLYEMLKANWQVAYEVMTSNLHMKPGIVKIELDAKTDLEITMLSNLISLTPGTLVVDVSDDRRVMYVHGMYLEDREKFIESIKLRLERPLLNIMR